MTKRRSDYALNQDNWDEELKHPDMENLGRASETCLSDRKILSIKHRTPKSGTVGLFKTFTGFCDYLGANASFQLKNGQENRILDYAGAGETEFLQELKALNESLLDWITRHVKKDPHCVLSPIFVDYEKHIKDLHQKFPKGSIPVLNLRASFSDSITSNVSSISTPITNGVGEVIPKSCENSTLRSDSDRTGAKFFNFGLPKKGDASEATSIATVESSLSLPRKPTVTSDPLLSTVSVTSSTQFLNIPPSTKATFSFGFLPSIPKSDNSPSQGILASGFSFNPSTKIITAVQSDKVDDNEDNEYVPPKPEVKEIKEEGSVYQTRCKLFYKRGDDWCERGLGNLYIKPTAKDRFQLLVRADTNLGNILLNILFTQDIPVRQQKNSLTFVCVPSPALPPTGKSSLTKVAGADSPSHLVPMLVRVKTESDASELLSKMNFYRGVEAD